MAIQIHTPWNKNRIIGQKKPLQIQHIWGIRIRLELEGRTRDLALFNLGLDSKLRGCDLVKLKVSDDARRQSCYTQNASVAIWGIGYMGNSICNSALLCLELSNEVGMTNVLFTLIAALQIEAKPIHRNCQIRYELLQFELLL